MSRLLRNLGTKGKTPATRPLYERPGFLLWRARHIADSIFTYECREYGVTPAQYLVLAVVSEIPGSDQASVSRTAGLDRFTTALVLSNCIKRGLILRERSTTDRRRYRLRISTRGLDLLKSIFPDASRARERLLSPFTPAEQRVFIGLLKRLVTTLNNEARAPVDEAALPYTQSHLAHINKGSRRKNVASAKSAPKKPAFAGMTLFSA